MKVSWSPSILPTFLESRGCFSLICSQPRSSVSAGREALEKGSAGTVVLVSRTAGAVLGAYSCVSWWLPVSAPGAHSGGSDRRLLPVLPVGSVLLTGSAHRERTSYGSCPSPHAPHNNSALPLWWPRLLSTPSSCHIPSVFGFPQCSQLLVLSMHWERTQPPTPIPTNR